MYLLIIYSIYFDSSLMEYLSWKNGLKGETYVAINDPINRRFQTLDNCLVNYS